MYKKMLKVQNDRLFMLNVLASIVFLCHQRLRSHRSKGVFSCFQLTYTYGVFRHGNPILESNSPYSNESFLLIYPIQDMRFEVDGFTSQGCVGKPENYLKITSKTSFSIFNSIINGIFWISHQNWFIQLNILAAMVCQ